MIKKRGKYMKNSINFVKENVNPSGRVVGDCVVRALVKASGRGWDHIYRELCDIGFKLKCMPNDMEAVVEWLKINGFKEGVIKVVKGSKRPTVGGFLKERSQGVFVLRVANHLTVGVNGVLYDLWDCREKCVYKYWYK